MRFVQNEIIPLFPAKGEGILDGKLIRSNDDVIPVRLCPAYSQFLATLRRPVVSEDLERRTKSFDFALPVHQTRRWNNDKMRPPDSLVAGKIRQQRNGLKRLSQTYREK